ncbi:MAG: pantoate--beta-alanine ligase [Actinobacteria bacterium]|uniref:pantoate--beta-alanine ligase (AMP-forming) n=1 Tax=freshwater metagenome TaxID=449393 RepID=A0A6J6NPB2_9ZZZZ|nr:pantoate--beta-alanine ligase [Actinomycetota bacterium]
MQIITSAESLAPVVSNARQHGKSVSFVPTMGALHDGHMSLVRIAHEQSDFVVVSIFVNPLQFGANEDFEEYPRTLQEDAEKLSAANVDVLFAPDVKDVYPHGNQITQHAGSVGETFEGKIRPGHFDGMLTVVARLFDLVRPDISVFGNKDAQQLFLIRQMVENSNHRWNAMQVVGAPIIREEDGLAMSSRNRYLSETERELAQRISRALRAAEATQGDAEARLTAAEQVMATAPAVRLDYVALINPATFEPIEAGFVGRALLIIAAQVGGTRLIDNLSISI